jgi:methyl-accepting chemotaxis protein
MPIKDNDRNLNMNKIVIKQNAGKSVQQAMNVQNLYGHTTYTHQLNNPFITQNESITATSSQQSQETGKIARNVESNSTVTRQFTKRVKQAKTAAALLSSNVEVFKIRTGYSKMV